MSGPLLQVRLAPGTMVTLSVPAHGPLKSMSRLELPCAVPGNYTCWYKALLVAGFSSVVRTNRDVLDLVASLGAVAEVRLIHRDEAFAWPIYEVWNLTSLPVPEPAFNHDYRARIWLPSENAGALLAGVRLMVSGVHLA